MSREYIAALDIGTSQVSCVVGRAAGDVVEVTGSGSAPSAGVRKGVIVDLDAVSEAVYEAVAEAEENSGVEIRTVYAGVAGAHIECFDSYGATGIRGKTVAERDINRVMEAASTVYVPLEREVLHVLPKDYAIDGQDGILKPHGMSGVRLEANVRIITAAQAALDNIVCASEKAGVKVVDMVFEALASARAVLSPAEMEAGAVVVDIGGGTTDVAVFREGGLAHVAVIPVGGSQFTNDLAVGLRLSAHEAGRVKKVHGVVAGIKRESEDFEAELLDSTMARFRADAVRNILEPRATELFEMVAAEIRPHLFDLSASTVVLTGGASGLRGLDLVAGGVTGIPARVGRPVNGFSEVDRETVENPAYATGVGLLICGHEKEAMNRGYLPGALGRKIKGIARLIGIGRGKGFSSRKHVLAEPGA